MISRLARYPALTSPQVERLKGVADRLHLTRKRGPVSSAASQASRGSPPTGGGEPPLLQAALDWAAEVPVFPCGGGKKPCWTANKDRKGGFHDASTDPAVVRRLFAHAGAKLIGVPTGEASGFDVLDFDYRNGAQAFEAANAHRLPETRTHQTHSGGRHYLFRHAAGMVNNAGKIAHRASMFAAKADTPSSRPSPGYTIISDAEIAHWPDWLLPLALPPPRTPRLVTHPWRRTVYTRLSEATRRLYRQSSRGVRAPRKVPDTYRLRNAALALGGIQQEAGFFTDNDAVTWLMGAMPDSVADWNAAEQTAQWGSKKGESARSRSKIGPSNIRSR